MIIRSNPEALTRHAEEAFERTVEQTLEAVRATAPVDSGAYRSSLTSARANEGERMVAHIGSPLPYASAIERGAWVDGPGPHMKPVGRLGATAEQSYKREFIEVAQGIPIKGGM